MNVLENESKIAQPGLKTAAASDFLPTDKAGISAVIFATFGLMLILWASTRLAAHPNGIQAFIGTAWFLLALGSIFLLHKIVVARHKLPFLITKALLSMVGSLEILSGLRAGLMLFGRQLSQDWLEWFVGLIWTAGIGISMYVLKEELTKQVNRKNSIGETDPLTGLLNREGITRHYSELKRGAAASMLMLGFNEPQKINEIQHNAISDAHFRLMARAIELALPFGGFVSRWSDLSFLILLPGRAERTALELSKRLQKINTPGSSFQGNPFSVGIINATGGRPLERLVATIAGRMYEDQEIHHHRQEHHELTGKYNVSSFEELSVRLQKLSDINAITTVGLEMARELLGFDASMYINREDENTYILRQLEGNLEAEMKTLVNKMHFGCEKGLIGRAIKMGSTLSSSDYTDDPEAHDESNLRVFRIKSLVVVPAKDKYGIAGVLILFSYTHWQAITSNIKYGLEAVAGRLENAFEREENIDERIRTLENGLLAIGLSLEARDLETAGHTERVVKMSERLGKQLGMSNTAVLGLRQGAYLHDMGKMSVPDSVLLKKDKLNEAEWVIMRTHTVIGYELASRIPSLEPASLEVIRHHHERWDGTGYPDRLATSNIPLGARVFSICDVWDALTSERPYKKAWTEAEALKEIKRMAGTHFDPDIVSAFEQVLDKVTID